MRLELNLEITVESDCEDKEAIINGLGTQLSFWVRKGLSIATAETREAEEISLYDFDLTDPSAQGR